MKYSNVIGFGLMFCAFMGLYGVVGGLENETIQSTKDFVMAGFVVLFSIVTGLIGYSFVGEGE